MSNEFLKTYVDPGVVHEAPLHSRDQLSAEMRRLPVATAEENLRLFEKYMQAKKSGSEAVEERNLIATVNVSFVMRMVNRFMRFVDNGKMDRDNIVLDLFQEGYFGLNRAIEKYDSEKGYTFTTYAGQWVWKRIVEGYREQYVYRGMGIPERMFDYCDKHPAVIADLKVRLGYDPAIEDVYAEYENLGHGRDFVDAVIDARAAIYGEGSVDDCADVADDLDVEEVCVSRVTRREILKDLTDDRHSGRRVQEQNRVVAYRYGFVTGEMMTYEQVGKAVGCSRQSVEQKDKSWLRRVRREESFRDRL